MSEDLNKTVTDLKNMSSGVRYLADGYIEYGMSVITDRALASLHDGLKPVQRRIIFTLKKSKSTAPIKSARLTGNVLALHPHGDASIYKSAVPMTDSNGSMAFPLLKGTGAFSSVIDTDKPAAARYTELAYPPQADEFFGEMHGITMIPNFDSTETEPVELPVSFPAVLINASSGIAVGFKSNMPSFNFTDVCNLVKEYIKDGKCTTVIEPDFVTGGEYVHDAKELQKLMQTGRAKLKLRGSYIVNGSKIDVTNLPYGKKIQNIVHQINNLESDYIKNAYDSSDLTHGIAFTVNCKNKQAVQEAIYDLYKNTDFQYTYSADMTVIEDGMPIILGVWGIIEHWVAWRRSVLEKEYNYRLEDAKEALKESKAVMTVVNDREKCIEFVNIVTKNGKRAGAKYIKENFSRDDIPEEYIDFVTNRALSVYNDGGKYKTTFNTIQLEIKELENNLADIDAVISKQMDSLIAKYGKRMPRLTKISKTDYNFTGDKSDTKAEDIKDTSTCYYTMKGNFLRKTPNPVADKSSDVISFVGTASDTLIALDNKGRLMRIYCEDMPMSAMSGLGQYIPRMCGISETDQDYKVVWIGRLTGETLMLLYNDGCVGFVDESEFVGNNRRVKVLEKGISTAHADKLCAVFHENQIPEALFVTTKDARVGWCIPSELKHKDRKARTRAFRNTTNSVIDSILPTTLTDIAVNVATNEVYKDVLHKQVNSNDIQFKANQLIPV